MPFPHLFERKAEIWANIRAWERSEVGYWEIFEKEPDGEALLAANRTSNEGATSPIPQYTHLCDQGSTLAWEHLAREYAVGKWVKKDDNRAFELYKEGLARGSWQALLDYSHLLARLGDLAGSIELLEQGVDADFATAKFWMAWRTHKSGVGREGYEHIVSLLLSAGRDGHPAASIFASRFLVTAKLGLSQVPRGIAVFWRAVQNSETASALD